MGASFRFLGGLKSVITFLAVGASAFLAHADLFISDYNNDVVYHFRPDNSLANLSHITGPSGLALGLDGNLYVATATDFLLGSSIQTFNPATGAFIGTFASHVSDNSMNNPGPLAFAANGNLYVGDLQNKILIYNSAGGSNVTTLTDFNVNAPSGLAFDPSGNLYVADENSGTVLKYSSGAFSVLNTSGAPMTIPHDVVVGPDGNLYILDAGSTAGIFALNPLTGFATKIVDYSTSAFFANDLALGPDGNLYVSGVDNNTGDGEILTYGTNGVGGSVYLDLGSTTYPTYMLFTVPEPSVPALLTIAGTALAVWGARRKNSAAK